MERLEALFPRLRGTAYRITSSASDAYNCLAWAAGDTEHWWWPSGKRLGEAIGRLGRLGTFRLSNAETKFFRRNLECPDHPPHHPSSGALSMSSLITLRLMAELPDEAAALHFENTVQTRITAFGNVKHRETLRYWKIPGWFEINFSLQPCTDPALAYEGILTSLGEGWVRHDFPGEYQWAVWNPKPDYRFFSSDVRWANVERFPESWIFTP